MSRDQRSQVLYHRSLRMTDGRSSATQANARFAADYGVRRNQSVSGLSDSIQTRNALSDDVGQQAVLDLGDLVLQHQLFLLQPLNGQRIGAALGLKRIDRLVEIAVLAFEDLEFNAQDLVGLHRQFGLHVHPGILHRGQVFRILCSKAFKYIFNMNAYNIKKYIIKLENLFFLIFRNRN